MKWELSFVHKTIGEVVATEMQEQSQKQPGSHPTKEIVLDSIPYNFLFNTEGRKGGREEEIGIGREII